MEEINILWFKKDLRIFDNEALQAASKSYKFMPIYIIEKELWDQKSYSDRQWQFCKECLLDLRDQLNSIGQTLIIRTGSVIKVFNEINKKFNIKGIYSHQETGDYFSYQRDKKVKEWASSNNIPWNEYLQFAVFRGLIDRDNWSKKWKNHIEKEIKYEFKKWKSLNFDPGDIPSDSYFKFKEDFCEGRLKGGRKEGVKRLEYFFKNKLHKYSIDISNPEKSFDSCSRLSCYLSWGCLSIREVFKNINTNKFRDRNTTMLKSRLTWHCHFIQKLESEPELEFREFHPYFSNIRVENEYLLKIWSEGKTGFPFIDACMRSLNYNGWLNFRMRAMLMSFASYNLWLPWQTTGTELAKKFIDYEPGIHWCQCQMQSGTTSININRIYNPIKQGKDHDLNGSFIKKWVPELKNIPIEFIHEPWLIYNKANFKSLEGSNYFNPVISIIESSKKARRKLFEISSKDGYSVISKEIYSKHGSRKSSQFRKKKSRKTKKLSNFIKQYELNLDS